MKKRKINSAAKMLSHIWFAMYIDKAVVCEKGWILLIASVGQNLVPNTLPAMPSLS